MIYDTIETTVCNLFLFAKFIFRTFKRENFKNYIVAKTFIGEKSKSLLVFANGPSLNTSIKEIFNNEDLKKEDVIMMNYTANEDYFYTIKPKYFCISDYMFYWFDEYRKDKVQLLLNNLNNRVDWKINVFLPYRWYKDKTYVARFVNPNINIVPFHTLSYEGFEKLRFPLMRKNIGGADFGSVLHNSINIGILLNYDKILLFGADHSFFDGLCVNSNNEVCKKTTHCYNNTSAVEPIFHYYSSGKKTPYSMSFFLQEYSKVFKGHDTLRRFSEYAGVEIINRTPNSMIDSYKRE